MKVILVKWFFSEYSQMAWSESRLEIPYSATIPAIGEEVFIFSEKCKIKNVIYNYDDLTIYLISENPDEKQ